MLAGLIYFGVTSAADLSPSDFVSLVTNLPSDIAERRGASFSCSTDGMEESDDVDFFCNLLPWEVTPSS